MPHKLQSGLLKVCQAINRQILLVLLSLDHALLCLQEVQHVLLQTCYNGQQQRMRDKAQLGQPESTAIPS